MTFSPKNTFKLIFFILVLSTVLTACNRDSSYVLSGRAADKKQSHFNPTSTKAQPIPKKFVIKNGKKTYLGQLKPN
ncbi:MAG: hypothetical protein PWQ54_13 [Bacteroidales bacterium]|jgi:hypothetical protein|nr:hypothetical protein [Bacteroidales bacterium]